MDVGVEAGGLPHLRVITVDGAATAGLRLDWAAGRAYVEFERARDDDSQAAVRAAILHQAAMAGCDAVIDERGAFVAVPAPAPDAALEERFLHVAAAAATAAARAVAACQDGAQADAAADAAAMPLLARLGIAMLSEEQEWQDADADVWIAVDPLDGTGNLAAGLPPWAFSAGLVVGGEPRAGLVHDLSSGRRWWASGDVGAFRDGAPISPRPGDTLLVPTPPPGTTTALPDGYQRLRITGSTAIDLCLVADGSAAAWHDLDRNGTQVHDVAGGLAILLAAGGTAVDADGAPTQLSPDPNALIRLVAAPSADKAARLRFHLLR